MAEETDIQTDEAEDIVAPVEGEDEDVQTAEPSELDKLATELGWNPDYEGDNKVDAAAFIRQTREIADARGKSLKKLERQVDTISRTTAQMTQRAVEAERERLEAMHEQAVEDGDAAAARNAVARMENLPTPQIDTPPEADDFQQRHSSWFNKDAEATAYAVNRCAHYAKEGLSPSRQLAAVEQDMKRYFPDLVKPDEPKPAAKAQPTLGMPQRQVSTQPREKGAKTLPTEAKKVCRAWVAEMKANGNEWATEDMWAASYYEQEAANG